MHPDDREGILKDYHSAFLEKSEFEFDYRLQYKDGSYRWIRDRGAPRFDSQNQLCGFIGSAWDLSEQKQATEEAHRAAGNTSLVQEVATIANSATTMREALQSSLNVICETLGFPVAHALLINDDEPGLAKSTHIVYVKDRERFAALFEMSNRMTWPSDLGAPGEVLRSGKPSFRDPVESAKDPEHFREHKRPLTQDCAWVSTFQFWPTTRSKRSLDWGRRAHCSRPGCCADFGGHRREAVSFL